jgi:transposase
MQVERCFIGVDVSKDELVIATEPKSVQKAVPNRRQAILSWLRTLPPGAVVAMESTGRYHLELLGLAMRSGLQVYVLNARDVYFYAKALGVRGKTDMLDAQVIARYLAEHHARLHACVPGTPAQMRVVELLRRRQQVQRHLHALRDCLDGVVGLMRQRSALQHQEDRLLALLDKKIHDTIVNDPVMCAQQQRLLTITGIGPQSSALLTAIFSRIGFANVRAVVAYSGLDPRPADSGTKRGRRKLTKRGPAMLRKLMWLAAFSASHSKVFKPVYESLRSKGLSSTEALVILGRKLLRIAWGVWRTGIPFDPPKLASIA